MTEEQKWAQINADKRRDILWTAAFNQASTLLTASGATGEEVEKLAKDIFTRMYAPYQPGGEFFDERSLGLNKVDMKKTANIDSEVEKTLKTIDYGF